VTYPKRCRPCLTVLAVAAPLLFAVAAAPPALAAGQRFASPTGSSSAPCTAASPCDIVTAINGDGMTNNPSAGDEVVVESGTYGSPTPLTTTLFPPVVETIHGVAGQPRPVIDDNASGEALFVGGASSVAYLDLETTAGSAVFGYAGATFDRLIAHSSSGDGCRIGSPSDEVTITNSVCWSSGAGGIGLETYCAQVGPPGHARSANVDAYATGTNGTGIEVGAFNSSCVMTLSATNVIARGTAYDAAAVTGASTNAATLTLDHSDYVSSDAAGPGTGASVTPAGSGSNITADPLLAGPGAGDFHETSASPTIDQGASDPANGPSDFEGDARTVGGTTDIGADEFLPTPVAVSGPAIGVSATGATLTGSVNPRGVPTTYRFVYGKTSTYGHSTAVHSAGSGTSSQPPSAAVTGLAPATKYHYRIEALSKGGKTVGADRTFTTTDDPFTGVVLHKQSVVIKKGKALVKLRCPLLTPPPCHGKLTLTYRRTTVDAQGHNHTKTIKLGSASFSLKAGKAATIKVKLNQVALDLLVIHKSLKAKASAKATDGAGRTRTRTAPIKLPKR
jgi:hypothetical protein